MKTKLTQGLSEQEISDLKQNYVHSLPLRRRLKEVLTKEIESLQSSMRSEEHFNSPNWALIQADRVAQTKALTKIISYLE